MANIDDNCHENLYRNHNIKNDNNKYICQDCRLNAWDEEFPEYCIGPTTEICSSEINTTDKIYYLNAKF